MPHETLWELAPHTRAKHDILKRYLEAWFPILNRYHGRIFYLDGFAGPGRYSGGEPGSPIIALDVACSHGREMTGEVVFYFVEANQDRASYLEQLLKQRHVPSNFSVSVVAAEFSDVMGKIMDSLEKRGKSIAPTFAFIDPFGFSGIQMSLIHRLLRMPHTEAFITFHVSTVSRFLEHPNEQVTDHFAQLFGTNEVSEVVRSQADRVQALRYLYQRQLQQAAAFVRFFTMHDQNSQPIYDLFFASNHELGHCKMKEAMWKRDPSGGIRFSDATDPRQPVLFTVDPAPDLLTPILQEFGSRSNVPVKDLVAWTRNSTPYLEKHKTAALQLGEDRQLLQVQPIKLGGGKRRAKTFPPDAIIDFPPS